MILYYLLLSLVPICLCAGVVRYQTSETQDYLYKAVVLTTTFAEPGFVETPCTTNG